jgi:hypothetical protein
MPAVSTLNMLNMLKNNKTMNTDYGLLSLLHVVCTEEYLLNLFPGKMIIMFRIVTDPFNIEYIFNQSY